MGLFPDLHHITQLSDNVAALTKITKDLVDVSKQLNANIVKLNQAIEKLTEEKK